MKTYRIRIQLEIGDHETDDCKKEDIEEYDFRTEEEAREFAYRIGDLLP